MLGDCGSLDASSNLAPGPCLETRSPKLEKGFITFQRGVARFRESRVAHLFIAALESSGRVPEAMKKPRGCPNPRERGCDDRAGGEIVRSTRGGEASPGILDAGEGLLQDRRIAREG